ncbi:hypothetical protein ACFPK1_03200 [Actinomycetospora rhizophila]|uniref:Uncharacterized protein n=1 Tax=Actinomycetospora rhizophila TaxID=1416876 RepID=A0ABV9Z6P6_9PSEU
MSMAVVMSEMPDVWRKVLAEHVPDAQQNCHECFQGGSRASWPCQTYRIAQEAKWVAEGGLPGTGPHGPGPSRTRVSPPEPEPSSASLGGSDALLGSSYDGSFGEPLSRHGDPREPAPATGGWALDDRPLAGDPLGETSHPTTGERPYGSTFDAPYGASFGVDDRLHASRW